MCTVFSSNFTVFKLISEETGPTSATKEHLSLTGALNIPVFIIITVWDLQEKEQQGRTGLSSQCLQYCCDHV